MKITRIAVDPGAAQPRCELVMGALAPRLIRRDAHSAHIGLTAAQMLLLDADVVELHIRVGQGCTLLLEDIGGTVAYPRRSGFQGPAAQWNVQIELQPQSRLIWESLPFVAAEGSETLRRTTVALGHNARALVRETLVLGRHGEPGGRLRSQVCADDPGGPVLYEDLLVDGSLPSPGVLGEHRVMDSMMAMGFTPETEPGDLRLAYGGAVARWLGQSTHESQVHHRFSHWKEKCINEM